MKTCDICFKGAMNHGGAIVSVPSQGVRHWRPKLLWPPTPQTKTRKPLPGTPEPFCVVHEAQEAKTSVHRHSNKSMAVPYGTR